MLVLIGSFILGIIISCVAIWGTDSNGYWIKKRLAKCFSDIEWYQQKEEKENLTFIYKRKEFVIKVEYCDNSEHYKSANFYINDECVLTLHSLVDTFHTVRLAEYSLNRHNYEVIKIIKAAQRVAKKKFRERITNNVNADFNNKSYFK